MAASDELIKIVEEAQRKIIENYNSMGLRASGRFERELNVISEPNRVRLVAPAYSWFMENGRSAGKAPPREVILQWIRDKQLVFDGISDYQASYLICRKIAREGISVPNPYNSGGVISNILNDDFKRDLTSKVSSLVGSIIINNLKQ